MEHRWFSLIDMAIVGVPAIVFGVWQLVSINREIAKDKAKAAASRDAESPESSGHAIGEHRLDDR
jgi:ABC-type phosphate transport system permease subunit